MKRNQGIWLVIAVILVVGVCSTSFTKRFVDRQETFVMAEAAKQEAGAGNDKPRPESSAGEKTAPENMPFAAPAPVGSALPPDSAEAGIAAETTLAIPPVAAPTEDATEAIGDSVLGTHRYIQKLEELDAEIEQNRADDKDKTTNTLKVNAEYELKVWEAELDSVLDTLSGKLNTDKYEALLAEQRSWIRERESTAMEASRKHSGSALESVEYTASLAEQTRTRVYDIVEAYHKELEAV